MMTLTDMDTHATDLFWILILLLNWYEDNFICSPYQRGTGRRQPLFVSYRCGICTYNIGPMLKLPTDDYKAKWELHPTIWNIIHALKWVQKRQREFFVTFSWVWTSTQFHEIQKSWWRILKIVSEYGDRNQLEYLSTIQHNLSHYIKIKITLPFQ